MSSLLEIFRGSDSVSDSKYLQILESEGIISLLLRQPIFDPDLSTVADTYFHILPTNPNDPRWQVAYQIMKLQNIDRGHFKERWQNAMRAAYLSPKKSYQQGNIRTYSEPNIRQIGRSIINLGFKDRLESAIGKTVLDDGLEFRFATSRLTKIFVQVSLLVPKHFIRFKPGNQVEYLEKNILVELDLTSTKKTTRI